MRLAIFSFAGKSTSLRIAVGSVLLSFVTTTFAAAEESYPYNAFVSEDRTQLRSGPGDDHYATDELRRGEEVEVYRRADGGWLAVRPPSTSFSWISQRDIKLTSNADVAEVVGTAAVSWIGSNRQDIADHRWLVKLDRGESVVLLGKERRRLQADGKSDLFYKIAPPSGEFRWLHEDDVVQEKSQLATNKDPNVALADFRVPLKGAPRAEPATGRQPASRSAPEPPASRVAAEPSPGRTETPAPTKKDGFSTRGKSGSSRTTASDVALIPKRSSNSAAAKAGTKSESVLTGDLDARLRELDAQLSLIAAQPAESWEFSALRASAEQLMAGGQSTLERARVQLFLDKLAEFDGLKSRHALMAPKSKAIGISSKPLISTSTTATDTGVDPRFDGTGWLLPVHSSKQSSPPYALLDKEGNILQFVSPAPGLNLNRYLRKEIGVFGQKDQPATLDKPHLTAHRIVELDRHRK